MKHVQTHGFMPLQIRPINALIRSMENSLMKFKIIEAMCRYVDQVPNDNIRHKKSEVPVRWYRERWNRLYYRKTGNPGEVLFIDYHPDVLWVYRGRFAVEADIFGDQAIICYDELRFSVPVYTKFSVDTGKRVAENEGPG